MLFRNIAILCAAMIAAGVIATTAQAQQPTGDDRSYLPPSKFILAQYYGEGRERYGDGAYRERRGEQRSTR
jgi:hypothetical protein